MHFENGRPVPSVDGYEAIYANDDPPERGKSVATPAPDESTLRLVLTAAFRPGVVRKDGLAAHMAAVALIVGGIPGYADISEAARSGRVSERSIRRAVARIRRRAKCQQSGVRNVNNDGPFGAPRPE